MEIKAESHAKNAKYQQTMSFVAANKNYESLPCFTRIWYMK